MGTTKSLDQWLDWQLSNHPQEIDLGLDRVRQVYQRLGLTLPRWVITIAGTNGKGSLAHFLQQILLNAGHTTGSYTSPHLTHYNERIRYNGAPVSDAAICQAFETIDERRGETSLTYFEYGTLAALDVCCRQQPVDVLILEVGLGGRLDAVNVVDPALVLFGQIGIDHIDWLSDDREAIGFEKAGVMRPNVPAFMSEQNPPQSMLSESKTLDAPLNIVGQDFFYHKAINHWHWRSATTSLESLPYPGTQADFQLRNISTVLAAVEQLSQQLPIPTDAIYQAIAKGPPDGRFQQLNKSPLLLIDVAHNPDSAQALADQLRKKRAELSGNFHAIIGLMKDKDAVAILNQLDGVIDQWHPVSINNDRAMASDELAKQIIALGFFCHPASNSDALTRCHKLLSQCGTDDLIVAFGSFHIAGQLLESRDKLI